MSTSDLYMVFRTTARHLHEYKNSSGTAPAIWAILCEDYLHADRNSWLLDREGQRALDGLAQDPRVPLKLRLVQAMCLQGAVIRPEDLREVAAACFVVHDLYQAKEPDFVNHWRTIGRHLEALASGKHGRAIGYALNCTSSCEGWDEYAQAKGKGFHIFDCVAYAKNAPAPEAAPDVQADEPTP